MLAEQIKKVRELIAGRDSAKDARIAELEAQLADYQNAENELSALQTELTPKDATNPS